MEDLLLDFEPFVSKAVRHFIVNSVNNYNIAVTGHAAYYPANFILRSKRGEVLGGLLGEIWGHWLQVKLSGWPNRSANAEMALGFSTRRKPTR